MHGLIKTIPVSDTASFKVYYAISEYTNGEWMFAWSDGRSLGQMNMGGGIYAQNIIEDGTLGPLFIYDNPYAENTAILIAPNPVTDLQRLIRTSRSGLTEIQY